MNWSSDRINFLLLVGYAFSLPFNEPYSKLTNVFMLLLAANWLRIHKLNLRSATVGLMLFFYLLHIIGLWHTENMQQGIFELDKKIGFFIFPLVLPAFSLDKDSIRKILLAFVVGIISASFVCLGYASWQYFVHGSSDYFYYHPLTDIIEMHAIYMAMYVSFAVFILIHYYWKRVLASTRFMKACFVMCLLYLIFFIFLLSARTIILGFSFILFGGLIVYGYRKKKLAMAAGIMTALLLLFAALVFLNDNNRERFKEAINYNSQYDIEDQYGGRSTRELIWKCAAIVIGENPVLGWGTGDAQDVLHQCYLDNDYGPLTYLPDLQYNAHSQYLQSWIDLGIPGLSVWLLILLLPALRSLRNSDYLFLSFITLFAIACSTESMLELKHGITFFSFFHCLLLQQTRHRALS